MECLGGPLRSADQFRLLATDWSLDEVANESDQFREPPVMTRGVGDLVQRPRVRRMSLTSSSRCKGSVGERSNSGIRCS